MVRAPRSIRASMAASAAATSSGFSTPPGPTASSRPMTMSSSTKVVRSFSGSPYRVLSAPLVTSTPSLGPLRWMMALVPTVVE